LYFSALSEVPGRCRIEEQAAWLKEKRPEGKQLREGKQIQEIQKPLVSQENR